MSYSVKYRFINPTIVSRMMKVSDIASIPDAAETSLRNSLYILSKGMIENPTREQYLKWVYEWKNLHQHLVLEVKKFKKARSKGSSETMGNNLFATCLPYRQRDVETLRQHLQHLYHMRRVNKVIASSRSAAERKARLENAVAA